MLTASPGEKSKVHGQQASWVLAVLDQPGGLSQGKLQARVGWGAGEVRSL